MGLGLGFVLVLDLLGLLGFGLGLGLGVLGGIVAADLGRQARSLAATAERQRTGDGDARGERTGSDEHERLLRERHRDLLRVGDG